MISIAWKHRDCGKKGESKRLRRDGFIPGVVYSLGGKAEGGTVARAAFEAVVRSLTPGFLPTTQFVLEGSNGSRRAVIVRDIQYHPVTYAVQHIDFMELHDAVFVEIKVPVVLSNNVDCAGVKLGGFLQYVMRRIRARCLPQHIPTSFEIDVKDMGIGQAKRVRDITCPAQVLILDDVERVVVTVAKK